MTNANDDEVGCGGCIAGAIALGLVIAAVISIAAIIDPFSWMPTVSEVWADCTGDACDLDERFPGFWWHVIANLAYAVLASVLLMVLVGRVLELRDARVARFDGDGPLGTYREARRDVAVLGAVCLVAGLVPLLIAL
jgi:hypothetical protein